MSDVIEQEMLVFDEFLWECFMHPHMHPGSRLTLGPTDCPTCHDDHTLCFYGSILWMGDVVYVIGDYEPTTQSWWAKWPD